MRLFNSSKLENHSKPPVIKSSITLKIDYNEFLKTKNDIINRMNSRAAIPSILKTYQTQKKCESEKNLLEEAKIPQKKCQKLPEFLVKQKHDKIEYIKSLNLLKKKLLSSKYPNDYKVTSRLM